jgi:hypothetical protein
MSGQQSFSKAGHGFDAAPALSDDECVEKLATLIEREDADNLDEIASLIGRLAVPIE